MIDKAQKQFQGFIATPPLWTGFLQDIKQFELPNLNFPPHLDLESHIPSLKGNYVMGKRMESFFGFIITASEDHQILVNNLQIIKDKVTLGELDFIIKDVLLKKPMHIEVVYKFYVYDPSYSRELDRWIGPNRRDSLLQKTAKLKEKQFPLLYREETKAALSKLNIDLEIPHQEVSFKANLFVPRQFLTYSFPEINHSCIAGVWIHFKNFTPNEYAQFEYFAPSKQDWPMLPGENKSWFPYHEILPQVEDLTTQGRSPLVWVKKSSFVYERMFVVWW